MKKQEKTNQKTGSLLLFFLFILMPFHLSQPVPFLFLRGAVQYFLINDRVRLK